MFVSLLDLSALSGPAPPVIDRAVRRPHQAGLRDLNNACRPVSHQEMPMRDGQHHIHDFRRLAGTSTTRAS
jgi:hypothetical protein